MRTDRLVSKDNVNVREGFHLGVFEELAYEWGAQVHGEQFVVFQGMLGNLQYGGWADGQEKSL
jgi:hypothetical protein